MKYIISSAFSRLKTIAETIVDVIIGFYVCLKIFLILYKDKEPSKNKMTR